MIPIEFYVEFNLPDKVKRYSERNREETKSMFFLYHVRDSAQSFSQPNKNVFQKRYVGTFAIRFWLEWWKNIEESSYSEAVESFGGSRVGVSTWVPISFWWNALECARILETTRLHPILDAESE